MYMLIVIDFTGM